MIGYVIASYGSVDLAHRARDSIRKLRPDAPIVVEHDVRGDGYSATLNRGVAALPREVDVVCCLNADVEMFASDRAVVDLFARDASVAIVGPRQITPKPDATGGEEPGAPLYLIAHAGLVPDEDADGDEWSIDLRHRYWLREATADVVRETAGTFPVPTVPGSVFYIRRHVLDVLGGWPEWTRFYYEDTFLCYYARLYGWEVLYTGETTWIHLGERGAPLSKGDREDRMQIARVRFAFEAGRVGIPLRFDEALR